MRLVTSVFFLLLAAAALTAAPARAQNHLTWRACSGLATATSTETFACNLNATPEGEPVTFRLVGSFVTQYGLARFVGLEAIVDIATNDGPLPSWWHLAAGECRENSLLMNTTYTVPGLCVNPFAAGGAVGGGFLWDSSVPPGPGRARLRVSAAIATPVALAANVRYTAFDLRLDTWRTIDDGEPACGGCCTPVCLALTQVQLFDADGYGEVQYTGDEYTVAGWNGQAQISTPAGCYVVGGCPTAERSRTWGAIRSLYR